MYKELVGLFPSSIFFRGEEEASDILYRANVRADTDFVAKEEEEEEEEEEAPGREIIPSI